jgi:outer membrane protein assembly factor BamD (BamD/ComL family)
MKRSVLALLLLFAALLAGCGLLPSEKDETSAGRRRNSDEAKDAMANKTWDKAIKYLKSWRRHPYGARAAGADRHCLLVLKNGEAFSAIAAAASSLYPNHANIDYAYYLGPGQLQRGRRHPEHPDA